MKKKKLILLFLSLVLIGGLLIFLVLFLNRPKNYTIEYNLDGFDIKESYDVELGYYHFIVLKDNKKFESAIINKWIGKKNLIDAISLYENGEENEVCILLKSRKLKFYPVCSKDESLIDLGLLKSDVEDFFTRDEIELEDRTYKNISIKTFNEKKFLVWAHKGYYGISSEKFMKSNSKDNVNIEFLKNESYYNKLAYHMNEFVITPNYDEEHSFKTFYIFNFLSGSLTKWDLDIEISYNSYYLGDYNNKIYMFDRKNGVEYSIDPKKKIVEKITEDGIGKAYLDGWKEVSITKLSSNDYFFSKKQVFNYSLDEKGLILKYANSKIPILVSMKKPDKIVSQKNDEIYYLVGDKLYMYSLKSGEILLLSFSEWEFNNMNSVFIY